MDASTVLWIGGGVALFVFVDVLLVEFRRCRREAGRIITRLAAFADLPVVSLAAATPGELARLLQALTAMADLLVRARAALAALGFARSAEP